MGSSSLTSDGTWAPCVGSVVLASGPPGKSLSFFNLFVFGFASTNNILLHVTLETHMSIFLVYNGRIGSGCVRFKF